MELVQERGHVFILTDLLLICEWMSAQDAAQYGPNGPDIWLLYPPLAGKHLRVAPLEGSGEFTMAILLRVSILILWCQILR